MMLDWFGNKKTKEKETAAETEQSNAVLRVIGDRSSGKTTYMASLARWPNADPSSPVQTVSPVNKEGEELIAKARDILEQGLELEATDLSASIDDVKDYTLSIRIKQNLSWRKNRIGSQLLTLNISCKDYAGEFFSDLIQQWENNPILYQYLKDCLQASGLMFLLDGASHRKDAEYANGLDRFLMALDSTKEGIGKRRLALVLTKCEQPELWVNRDRPKYLASARFPQFCQKLESWQQKGSGSVDYFTTSAFGVLGSRFPAPNADLINRGREGTRSVIKDQNHWRPFGLVAPIYWLCTGERHKKLEM